jgi:uncharacterized membrane protein
MIPPVFHARHFLVLLTGALEMAGAIGLFLPFFRRPAAFWISILMVAIFPANVYAAGTATPPVTLYLITQHPIAAG